MHELINFLPLLNLVVVPALVFIVKIEKRNASIDAKLDLIVKNCPLFNRRGERSC